jgi:integrase
MSILERYVNHPRDDIFGKALPVFSNQKLKGYLKEIADLCDVKKELAIHCARHTFATTVTLTNGVPIETVSKMLGHKNIRTTQIHAKIVNKKVSEDMMVLRNRLSSFEPTNQIMRSSRNIENLQLHSTKNLFVHTGKMIA